MKITIRADNAELADLIRKLQLAKKPFWKAIAYELAKPRRRRNAVNLSKLELFAGENVLVVPGKVLGSGHVMKKYTVAAFSFSESAKSMIAAAGGKVMGIDELYSSNPDAKNLVIIK